MADEHLNENIDYGYPRQIEGEQGLPRDLGVEGRPGLNANTLSEEARQQARIERTKRTIAEQEAWMADMQRLMDIVSGKITATAEEQEKAVERLEKMNRQGRGPDPYAPPEPR